MKFEIEPEIAGGWGDGTEVDTSVHPPKVSKLVYEFENWLGDDILESFPCYIVTEVLAQKILKASLTGVEFDTVEISKSQQFIEVAPSTDLPEFKWLKIVGSGNDDFTIGNSGALVVSTRALNILEQSNIENCDVRKAAT